jgi:hypothetical protein
MNRGRRPLGKLRIKSGHRPQKSGQAGYFDKVYPFEFLREDSELNQMDSAQAYKGRLWKQPAFSFWLLKMIDMNLLAFYSCFNGNTGNNC